MNNVVSINSKKFLGSYLYAQDRRGDFEEAFLFLGTVTSIITAPAICLAYAGIVPFLILASALLTGTTIGYIAYRRRRPRRGLRFAGEAVPKAPPSGVRFKKVA